MKCAECQSTTEEVVATFKGKPLCMWCYRDYVGSETDDHPFVIVTEEK